MKIAGAIVPALIALCVAIPGSADAGLLGHWKFDEGKGLVTRDSSGNGHHGEIVGARWVEGVSGTALEFTGALDSYVEVPHSDELAPADAVTVTAWAKVYNCRTWHSCLVYKSGEPPMGNGFGDRCYTLWATRGGLHFTSTPEGAFSQIRGDSYGYFYPPDEFAHFAMVVDCAGRTMTGYINGQAVAKTPYYGQRIRGGRSPLRLGGYWQSNGDQSGLTGVLDEVRIYGNALTPEEILEDMNAGREGVPPPESKDETTSESVVYHIVLLDSTRSNVIGPLLPPPGAAGNKDEKSALPVAVVDMPHANLLDRLDRAGSVAVRIDETLSAKPGETVQVDLIDNNRDENFRLKATAAAIDWEKRILEVNLEIGLGRKDLGSSGFSLGRLVKKTVPEPAYWKRAEFIIRSGGTAVLVVREGDTKTGQAERLVSISPELMGGEWRARLKEARAAVPGPSHLRLEVWPDPSQRRLEVQPDQRIWIGPMPQMRVPNEWQNLPPPVQRRAPLPDPAR